MRKIITVIASVIASVTINAQVIKVYNTKSSTSVPVATFTNSPTESYEIVFEEKQLTTTDDKLIQKWFSVSTDDKVQFTNGNVKATYSSSSNSYILSLYDNQYDYAGWTDANRLYNDQPANGDVVDLFAWSTTSTTYGIARKNISGDFVDWGNAFPDKGYRTLTGDEWGYLMFSRTVNGGVGEGYSYKYTHLNLSGKTIKGMLLLPDDYNGTPALSEETSSEDWAALEANGAVFLPAAGERYELTIYNRPDGGYWASTKDIYGAAYYLNPFYCRVSSSSLFYGYSVRLVK